MTLCLQVIGKTGQLARALDRQASKSGYDVTCHGRSQIDLTSPATDITAYILELPDETDAVIVAAAYTDVDKAETDHETAFAVNGTAPKIIADACAERGFSLVHISTDYVFDGQSKAPYKIDHPTNPINTYGASKRKGEKGVIESEAKCAVLRTSWVFDGIGKNFLTTMLRLGETRQNLSVVGDQKGRPTYAGDLADAAIATALYLVNLEKPLPKADRLFHVSNSGQVISWAGFAEHIFESTRESRMHEIVVTRIPTSEYPTPATRPLYSVLDTAAFEQRFSHALPSWESGVDAAFKEAGVKVLQ